MMRQGQQIKGAHCAAPQIGTASTKHALQRCISCFAHALTTSKEPDTTTRCTNLIWLGTCQQLAKLDLAAMAISFPHIAYSVTVRDLGLTLDQQLTFAPHINRLCRDCYYQLRELCHLSLSHFYC